jgi:hypothetical protein
MNITKVMDKKFIPIEFTNQLRYTLSPVDSKRYSTIPFSVSELEDARSRGMFLVAMPRVNLKCLPGVEIRSITGLGHNPEIAHESRVGYHLLGELKNSEMKKWDDQIAMLPPGFSVPYAVEMAYLAFAWYVISQRYPITRNYPFTFGNTVTSRFAFQNWVRCGDITDDPLCRFLVRASGPGGAFIDEMIDYPESSTAIAFGKFRPV